jgi:hypothetical protein
MMTIARLKEILGLLVEESDVASSFITGVADEDITAKLDRLKLGDYPVLVGIVPSLIGNGRNMDQLQHTIPMFIYCIESIGNYTENEIDERWDNLLQGVILIENSIKEHESDPDWEEFIAIAPESIHIDPEFGMWGCFGWSISFDIVN